MKLLLLAWMVFCAGLFRRRDFDPEQATRRLLCRCFGHDPLDDLRGAPVCEFTVCRRCGRILESLASWRLPK